MQDFDVHQFIQQITPATDQLDLLATRPSPEATFQFDEKIRTLLILIDQWKEKASPNQKKDLSAWIEKACVTVLRFCDQRAFNYFHNIFLTLSNLSENPLDEIKYQLYMGLMSSPTIPMAEILDIPSIFSETESKSESYIYALELHLTRNVPLSDKLRKHIGGFFLEQHDNEQKVDCKFQSLLYALMLSHPQFFKPNDFPIFFDTENPRLMFYRSLQLCETTEIPRKQFIRQYLAEIFFILFTRSDNPTERLAYQVFAIAAKMPDILSTEQISKTPEISNGFDETAELEKIGRQLGNPLYTAIFWTEIVNLRLEACKQPDGRVLPLLLYAAEIHRTTPLRKKQLESTKQCADLLMRYANEGTDLSEEDHVQYITQAAWLYLSTGNTTQQAKACLTETLKKVEIFSQKNRLTLDLMKLGWHIRASHIIDMNALPDTSHVLLFQSFCCMADSPKIPSPLKEGYTCKKPLSPRCSTRDIIDPSAAKSPTEVSPSPSPFGSGSS